MDALVGLLYGPRARSAFLLRAIMNPPWSVRVEDRAPLCLIAMVQGEAWVTGDEAAPRRLGAGSVAIVRGPDPYTLADDPATPPQAVIRPGQRCATPDGTPLEQAMDLGVRTWGNDPRGSTIALIGTYENQAEVSQRLLGALPPMVVLGADTWDSPLPPLLADEIVKEEAGQEIVLDRLLDLLVVAVLRTWFSRPEAEAPAWYQAHSDPGVRRVVLERCSPPTSYAKPTRPSEPSPATSATAAPSRSAPPSSGYA